MASNPNEPPPPYPGPATNQKGGYPQAPPAGSYPQAPPAGSYPQAPPAGGYPQAPPAGGYPQAPPPGSYPQASAPVYPQGGPSPGYPPGQGQPGSVIITQPTVVTTIVQQFKDIPVQTNCPSCHAEIITSIEFETGTLTWLLCVIICLVGCDLGCCFIPFCVDQCKDVVHRCPNCQHIVSRWSRL
ncbi:hypothetical protein LSH36_549g01080 [Paralvinella palmiformis]|uniref:LITAF domain-containing protein n=1 Tax=Paralvinella palmiformis TaxID=53620 RepID=A0AAD9J7D9_9ANNE|nr:hypothetical protein LSH36_549g01080 [Paralvinella palmiformis]